MLDTQLLYRLIAPFLDHCLQLPSIFAGDQEGGLCNRLGVGYGVPKRRDFGSDIECCASAQGCDTARTSVRPHILGTDSITSRYSCTPLLLVLRILTTTPILGSSPSPSFPKQNFIEPKRAYFHTRYVNGSSICKSR